MHIQFQQINKQNLNKKQAPTNGAIINPGSVQKKSLKERRREKAQKKTESR